jgi:hypothetical protein
VDDRRTVGPARSHIFLPSFYISPNTSICIISSILGDFREYP